MCAILLTFFTPPIIQSLTILFFLLLSSLSIHFISPHFLSYVWHQSIHQSINPSIHPSWLDRLTVETGQDFINAGNAHFSYQ